MEELLLEKETKTKRPDFVKLYKEIFPKVARHIGAKGGTLMEAKDVFQDALIIYFEKVSEGTLSLRKGEHAFIFGTAKNLWIDRYRQRNREQPLEKEIDVADEKDKKVITSKVLLFLERSGKKCMDLLQSFYYQKLPLTEIAEKFGFSGTRSATVQKYKCIEKVRDIVKEKSLRYEDFLE